MGAISKQAFTCSGGDWLRGFGIRQVQSSRKSLWHPGLPLHLHLRLPQVFSFFPPFWFLNISPSIWLASLGTLQNLHIIITMIKCFLKVWHCSESSAWPCSQLILLVDFSGSGSTFTFFLGIPAFEFTFTLFLGFPGIDGNIMFHKHSRFWLHFHFGFWHF